MHKFVRVLDKFVDFRRKCWTLNHTFYLISFQVIISCSWIVGVIVMIPAFMFRTFNKEWKYCINTWPEEWIGKAFSMSCLILVLFPVALMAALYSRVVYSLWVKQTELNENNNLQQVRNNEGLN